MPPCPCPLSYPQEYGDRGANIGLHILRPQNPWVLMTSNCLSLLLLCDVLCHMEPSSVDLEFSLSRGEFILFYSLITCILLFLVLDEVASSSAAFIFGDILIPPSLQTPDLPHQTCLSVASLRQILMYSNNVEDPQSL